MGSCVMRAALPNFALIVFREFKEFREFRDGSCVLYATLPNFPNFSNYPKFPNKKKIAAVAMLPRNDEDSTKENPQDKDYTYLGDLLLER